ncbi:MAG TPA: RNA polymerase sigma factor [Acholeplasmataceae bacterium]|jgi:RNA polymerase sigma-70 factor (ECF subfamily)|nr:RNA polymerase sigma factor [Acholeplasmataceae bacterium]
MMNYDFHIEALKNKDEGTFALIYHDTKHAVYALILSIIKDRSLAHDIMQETYLTMLEKISTYKPGSNFKTWLLTIARNKAIDYYRKRKREEIIAPEEIVETVAPEGIKSAILSEVLELLNAKERSIFMLYAIQRFKHREIAQILDLPLGTVLWLYQKALKKVKSYFKER